MTYNFQNSFSPVLAIECGIHLEVPSKFVFEVMLQTLNIHFNFGGFPNFGRLSQDPRWRTAAILELEVWLSQCFFGVYQCVIYVEILKLGPGIHSRIYQNPQSLFSCVSTPRCYWNTEVAANNNAPSGSLVIDHGPGKISSPPGGVFGP